MKFLLLCLAMSCFVVRSEYCTDTAENGTCEKKKVGEKEEDDFPCFEEELPRLFRWDPVKVGHKRKIHISPGQEVDMITQALKPLLFEIPKFLSDEECNALIELGKSKMMIGSKLHDVENRAGKLVTEYEDYIESIHFWDRDDDHKITINEVIHFAKKYKYLYITSEEVHEIYKKLNIKPENKEFLTEKEFHNLPFRDLHVFFAELKVRSPKHRDRYSYQAWIHHQKSAEPIVKKLQKRVEKITKLTEYQVRAGEPLQVCSGTDEDCKDENFKSFIAIDRVEPIRTHWGVNAGRSETDVSVYTSLGKVLDRNVSLSTPASVYTTNQIVMYTKDGIFNTHHDSQDKEQYPDLKCCHLDVHAAPKCRLCRFITIMYYLNTMDEEAGGETAFNFADNSTLDVKGMERYFESDLYNLRKYCHKANLVIKPVKGTAIMWYNHFVNEATGWLGKTDVYALHGGCPVLSGEKWIANTWITAPDAEQAHLISHYNWED